MITEWLSFRKEFIPSQYISLYHIFWFRDEILFPYKPFRNEFIPVFIPNEILVMVRNFFLVSYKLKTNFAPIENRKSCSLGACCVCVSDLARKPRDRERQSSLSYECSTNFILERNSFRNESHPGIISTAPRCMNELFVLIFHFKIWFFQVPHFDYVSILYIVVYMERYMWIIISI